MTDFRSAIGRDRAALAACVGALIALAGCSSSSGSDGSSAASSPAATTASASGPAASGSSTPTGTTTITIKNFGFSPATLTVRPGAKITVVNQDSTAHTVTADGSKQFDTGNVAPNKTTTFSAPTKPGTYNYICTIHQFMKGTLKVS